MDLELLELAQFYINCARKIHQLIPDAIYETLCCILAFILGLKDIFSLTIQGDPIWCWRKRNVCDTYLGSNQPKSTEIILTYIVPSFP